MAEVDAVKSKILNILQKLEILNVNVQTETVQTLRQSTLLTKLQEADKLLNNLTALADLCSKTSESELYLELLKKGRLLHKSIKDIITNSNTYKDTGDETNLLTNPSGTTSQIAEMASFDHKEAASIVPIYNGAPDELEQFIRAAKLLEKLNENNKETVFAFLVTRLSKKAEKAITAECENTVSLLTNLRKLCASKTTSDDVLAKLKATKHKPLDELCKHVEELTGQLNEIFIREQFPPQKAAELACQAGIDALIEGIDNLEIKRMIVSGNFTTVPDAIKKINRYKSLFTKPANVLAFGHSVRGQRPFHNNRGMTNNRGRNAYYNNNNNNNRQQSRQFYNGNVYNNNSYRNNNRGQGQHNNGPRPNQNFRGHGGNRNSQYNQRYVRVAENIGTPSDNLQSESAVTLEENQNMQYQN